MKKISKKAVNNKKIIKNDIAGKWQNFPFIFFCLALVILFIIFSKATFRQSESVKLYFKPRKVVLSTALANQKSKSVKIMARVGKRQLAFAKLSFTFDPRKVNLASRINTNPNLSTIIQQTDNNQANKSGRVLLVIAASPEDKPPSGNVELASFRLKGIGTEKLTTNIDFLISEIQLVDKKVNQLKINKEKLKIKLVAGANGL